MKKKSQHTTELIQKSIVTVILLIGSVGMLLPFLWMVSTALKSPDFVMVYPPQWIPDPVQWKNFAEAWTTLPFTLYLQNTLFITTTVIFGTVLTSSMAAFAFARLKFKGREWLFMATLATMMLPSQVTIIPIFLMFRHMGLLNTFTPLTIGAWLGGGAMNIFLMRQFILTLPPALDEAAKLDGCNPFQIYWHIVLPLMKPCLAVIAAFTFLGTWNDFMGPMIYLTTPDKMTLALGLQFFQGHYGITTHLLMAVSLLVMTPCLLLFFFAQKQFISGITLGGVKG